MLTDFFKSIFTYFVLELVFDYPYPWRGKQRLEVFPVAIQLFLFWSEVFQVVEPYANLLNNIPLSKNWLIFDTVSKLNIPF